MVQLLQTLSLLAFIATIATSSASLTATVVSPKHCESGQGCLKGQVCVKQEIVCITTPCNPVYTCMDKANKTDHNPCKPGICPEGVRCVAGKSKGAPNEDLPVAICVPPCLCKYCGDQSTCVMKRDSDGHKKATCVPISKECYPEPQVTCANVRCIENTECKMVGCEPYCIPSFLCPIHP